MVKKVAVLGTMYALVGFAIVHLATFPRPIVKVEEQTSATSVKGFVQSVYTGKYLFALRTSTERDFIVAIASTTSIRNVVGELVDFTTLQPGMEVASIGLPFQSNHIAAESVLIINSVE